MRNGIKRAKTAGKIAKYIVPVSQSVPFEHFLLCEWEQQQQQTTDNQTSKGTGTAEKVNETWEMDNFYGKGKQWIELLRVNRINRFVSAFDLNLFSDVKRFVLLWAVFVT